MKKLYFLFLVLIFPWLCNAQFEQKLSLNIGSGIFKTLGKKFNSGNIFQMANYKLGIAENLGVQFNINRRFSLLAEAGYLYSGKWDYGNELHFSFEDPMNLGTSMAEGYNDLKFSNISLGVKPKYFLRPGEKWNLFIFLGLYLNFTRADFSDNYWAVGKSLYDQGKLPNFLNDNPLPYDPWLEKNTNIGFNPGTGLEYNLSDKVGFSVSAGYYFMLLNKNNFKNDKIIENFNAILIQAAIRFNFLKSKKL
jgi:hypothetical protein